MAPSMPLATPNPVKTQFSTESMTFPPLVANSIGFKMVPMRVQCEENVFHVELNLNTHISDNLMLKIKEIRPLEMRFFI